MENKIKNLIDQLKNDNKKPSINNIIALLELKDDKLNYLYKTADQKREETMGNTVYLRGIIEFSNYCKKNCNYCGIRKERKNHTRYRMTMDEIVENAQFARDLGYTTVVLQSGEDPWFNKDRICKMVQNIKQKVDVAITLSVGEWQYNDYIAFKAAGADRYLLRFETSSDEIFKKLHPDDDLEYRINCLKNIRKAKIQLGTGFMIGLPYSTYETLAQDILFLTDLNADMIGIGPFISHPETPLKDFGLLSDIEVYFKVISIVRLLNPYAHIPATTAFDVIDKHGRDKVLKRGANVFMPNVTPKKYRKKYMLYPNKPCVDEDGIICSGCVKARMQLLGRTIGTDYGHSFLKKHYIN